MEPKEKLIVALDLLDEKACLALVDTLSPVVDIFKVGIAPFTGFGHRLIGKLNENDKKIFLDLKFHDIPSTVRNAARTAAKMGAFMMNFHCMGGGKMLEEAASGAEKGSDEGDKAKPILLGVTVLTSMGEEDMMSLGIEGTVADRVMELALIAKSSGMDGVVASAKEAKIIKERLGEDFIVVTPGIRPAWAARGDQKRDVTPRMAMEAGADYIVVGRPIIGDKDPLHAAERIIEEMGGNP